MWKWKEKQNKVVDFKNICKIWGPCGSQWLWTLLSCGALCHLVRQEFTDFLSLFYPKDVGSTILQNGEKNTARKMSGLPSIGEGHQTLRVNDLVHLPIVQPHDLQPNPQDAVQPHDLRPNPQDAVKTYYHIYANVTWPPFTVYHVKKIIYAEHV